jgi:hypothetical protein
MRTQEFGEFLGEGHSFVVLGLTEDIVNHLIALRDAYRKRSVALPATRNRLILGKTA